MTNLDPKYRRFIEYKVQCSMLAETSRRVGQFFEDGSWMDFAFNILDTDLDRLEQDGLKNGLKVPRFFELGRAIQEHLHSILSLLNSEEHLCLRDRYIKVKGPATKIEKNIAVRFYDTSNRRVAIIEMTGTEYYNRLKPIFDPILANEKPRGEFLLDRFGKTSAWGSLRVAIEELDKLSLVGK